MKLRQQTKRKAKNNGRQQIVYRNLVQEKHSELFWLASNSWVATKRSITHIIRSLDQVMSLILFPVMFMLLNRYVLGGAINTGISYANYLFAGILIQTLACWRQLHHH